MDQLDLFFLPNNGFCFVGSARIPYPRAHQPTDFPSFGQTAIVFAVCNCQGCYGVENRLGRGRVSPNSIILR
ncbi:hypothetical protein EMPG_17452 [Blastomyces silverae]|uniref:Uncharacterized protein n=1 Tax=Blastomyces silverae TaxID=2060906 RepID=A0A0H1B7I4_9EURO|nr:hypothetical protein EMPG_17452 [Blastomyces silverae]